MRQYLRLHTDNLHTLLDAYWDRIDIHCVQSIGDFFAAHAEALYLLEELLEQNEIRSIVHDWQVRKRSDFLQKDLSYLHYSVTSPPISLSRHCTPSFLIGVLYVLEGSRLGSAFIAQHLATSTNELVKKTQYFFASSTDLWKTFLPYLEDPMLVKEEVVEGSCFAYQVFLASFSTHLSEDAAHG